MKQVSPKRAVQRHPKRKFARPGNEASEIDQSKPSGLGAFSPPSEAGGFIPGKSAPSLAIGYPDRACQFLTPTFDENRFGELAKQQVLGQRLL